MAQLRGIRFPRSWWHRNAIMEHSRIKILYVAANYTMKMTAQQKIQGTIYVIHKLFSWEKPPAVDLISCTEVNQQQQAQVHKAL